MSLSFGIIQGRLTKAPKNRLQFFPRTINIEKLRSFLSATFNFELFPSDVYLLEQLPSEINIQSILVIFIFSLAISALASYFPALSISKMKTFRALRYE